jgi:hypothetical protein
MASADLEEKLEDGYPPNSPTDTADSSIEEDLPLPASKEFGAITPASRSTSHARNGNPNSIRSISRTRSNNGYGCDEAEDSGSGGDVEGGPPVEKDPFEVRWDGDGDPLNPRSMAFVRKWVVVIVVSVSSLCV